MRSLAVMVLAMMVLSSRCSESGDVDRAALSDALTRAVAAYASEPSLTPSPAEGLVLAEAQAVLETDVRARARRALKAVLDGPAFFSSEPAGTADISNRVLAWLVLGDEAVREGLASQLDDKADEEGSRERFTLVSTEDFAQATRVLAEGGCALGRVRVVQTARAMGVYLRKVGIPSDDPGAAADLDAIIASQLALYHTTGELDAFTAAVELQDRLDRDFWDDASGAYRGEPPAAALSLIRLGRLTDDDAYTAKARRILAGARARGIDWTAHPLLLAAWIEDASPILHLTLIGGADEPGTAALLTAAHRTVVPGFAITILDESDACRALRQRFPGMPLMPREGKAPTAYLCTATACDPPTTDPAKLAQRIAELSKR